MDSLQNDLCKELAKRLTALRLQKEWTRETLADQSNINVHTLKRFERTGQISLYRLVAICQALGVMEEIMRLFKPRQRINVTEWKIENAPTRRRGRRKIYQAHEQ